MSTLDLAALDRAGWQLLHGVLDRPRLERLRRAFADPGAGGTEHVRLTDATPHRDDWRALADLPQLRAAAVHLLGPDFHVHDAHGRNPRPGHGQQGLHADWKERAPGDPVHVLTALFLLDDFTRHNGATRLVPGTHLLYRPVPRALAQPASVHPGELVVTGPAGALLLMNGHLWHSGRRNDSRGPRRAIQLLVMRGARTAA